jgi:hypothetical protein
MENRVTLVLYPNVTGLGYVIASNPKEIFDYGVRKFRPFSRYKFIKKVRWFIDNAKPKLVILLNYDKSHVSPRVVDTIKEIEALARTKNLEIMKYSKMQIRDTFSVLGASTKFEISVQIMNWYSELETIIPPKRMPWKPEHYQMEVFDAFALLTTHFYLKE